MSCYTSSDVANLSEHFLRYIEKGNCKKCSLEASLELAYRDALTRVEVKPGLLNENPQGSGHYSTAAHQVLSIKRGCESEFNPLTQCKTVCILSVSSSD